MIARLKEERLNIRENGKKENGKRGRTSVGREDTIRKKLRIRSDPQNRHKALRYVFLNASSSDERAEPGTTIIDMGILRIKYNQSF